MTDPKCTSSPSDVNIMLVSHTNVGKTTLLRTLVGKDVGEVMDAPDVTKVVSSYDLVCDDTGATLRLWDTPGFADSHRLAKRLQQRYRLIAWIVRELWDRFINQRLWRSQRVVMDLKKRADVILYLANAQERPVDAPYYQPELEVLRWVGKPVLAVINQGANLDALEAAQRNETEWRNVFAQSNVIKKTLSLDSFTRCWLHEMVLVDDIGLVLPENAHRNFLPIADKFHAVHLDRFEQSIAALSAHLVGVAADKVELPIESLGTLGKFWGWVKEKFSDDSEESASLPAVAMKALTQRLLDGTKTAADKLIQINRLSGASAGQIIEVAAERFASNGPVDEIASALGGGVVAGALTGLSVDLLSGGLTLGTGALVGAILGGMGGAAIAKGYNIYTSQDKNIIGWSANALTDAFTQSVMLYLAIAHFGRGQGEWLHKEAPTHWQHVVSDSINRYSDRMTDLWTRVTTEGNTQRSRDDCATLMRNVVVEILQRLYPEARSYLRGNDQSISSCIQLK